MTKQEQPRLRGIIPIPSLSVDEGGFYNGSSLIELAEIQKVKPLRNPLTLVGAIPSDHDVDAFLGVIYSSRKWD
jgi:hypothetical protein